MPHLSTMSGANLGYLIAFLSMFIGVMSNFPFTDVARRWGSVALNHFRLLVGLIALTAVCMVVDKLSFTNLFT
ncbi:MAG TPA: hypothetical protein VK806_03380, partial [Bacteroidia bacterium]|nr:hypothetical protein [Bacteroidia bacterium]